MDEAKRKFRNSIRFWSKVRKDVDDSCWLWTGAKDGCGYGVFWVDGANMQAHRFSMQMHLGVRLKSPTKRLTGTLVLHKCDNPACVNPCHLFLGTQADNMRDRNQKDRLSRGERRYNHKLTDEAVRKIRRLYKTGYFTLRELGDRFGVDLSVVSLVVRRTAWKHVT